MSYSFWRAPNLGAGGASPRPLATPLMPWFNGECRSLHREARRLERLYRRARAPADRVALVKYVLAMHRTYRDREREHWEARIAAHSEQPKRLWTTFNALLGRERAGRSANPTFFTAENYLASFQAKVQTIRDDTASSPPPRSEERRVGKEC